MNIPIIKNLNLPELISEVSGLATKGKLTISDNNLVYLDVHDDYIHRLFPLLANQKVMKPNYFGTRSAGAHISVIYPEENVLVMSNDLNDEHNFQIKGAFTAEIGLKRYYVLMVDAPSLLLFRRKYSLSDMLPFKGYSIGFHITIGVQPIDR